MAGKQAQRLSVTQQINLLVFALSSRNPIRNRVLVSLNAGLRAGETSARSWAMVLDPAGEVATGIQQRRGGRVLMHPSLRASLRAGRKISSSAPSCDPFGMGWPDDLREYRELVRSHLAGRLA